MHQIRWAVTLLLVCAPGAAAEEHAEADSLEDEPAKARIYTTREERREAGTQRHLTSWLSVSDLIEVEAGRQWMAFADPEPDDRDGDLSTTLELGAEVAPLTWLRAEAIVEVEHEFEGEGAVLELDEGTASLILGSFEVEGGRVYVPFGEYFSHLASGPLLEFGETRGDGVDLSWSPDDRIDVSAFLYHGPAESVEEDASDLDGGFALASSPLEAWMVGVSYLTDLADSRAELLDAYDHRYQSRVEALSAHTMVGVDRFELTAEAVWALESFEEFPSDRDRPSAWNVEVAFFPEGTLDGALRVEGSSELEDAPRLQGGMAVSWRPLRKASITLEYLYGSYAEGLSDRETSGRFGALATFVP
ncbi:MAG TPA: hypothetical protein VFP10_05800 [Candidatus Eisenbacteria bacterium]|nr:hypothetical protein [Candidatus Eisenbacteria bacterium]